MSNIDFTNFLSSMLASITTTQVLTVLASVVGVGMTFFLMWLGVRLITNRFTKAIEGGNITGTFSYEELKEGLEMNANWEENNKEVFKEWYEKEKRKTIGQSELAPRPIEPVEPSGKPMTKEERKEFDDYYATHDSYGHKLGYDKRQWENYYKKKNYKKKYNNYKKIR